MSKRNPRFAHLSDRRILQIAEESKQIELNIQKLQEEKTLIDFKLEQSQITPEEWETVMKSQFPKLGKLVQQKIALHDEVEGKKTQ